MRLRQLLRRVLPWLVSAALLVYVFGWLTEWDKLIEATQRANAPIFVLVTFADKMIFFVFWTMLQVQAVRRIVVHNQRGDYTLLHPRLRAYLREKLKVEGH